jgi:Family of unknown function (DUF6339)
MPELLQILNARGRKLLTPEDYANGVPPGLSSHFEPFTRSVDLEPLHAVLREAMERFDRPSRSDGWLAPRVHATLRLYRREAADMNLWYFLSAACRDYVIWRWEDDEGVVDHRRITGRSERHALARLWWAAELIRNGTDYSPVEAAFELQTGIEFILSLDAFHNRATALAFSEVLLTGNDGARVRDPDIKVFARALNHVLTTVVLDDLVPDCGADGPALSEWMRGDPDETTMYDALPAGPDDGVVSADDIRRVTELIALAAPPQAVGAAAGEAGAR